MHWKVQRLQPALVIRKASVLLHDNARLHVSQPMLQKWNKLGYEVLPHPPYAFDLSPTNHHFFKHLNNFWQGKSFHNQQEAENDFQDFVKSWNMIFMLQEWTNLFLISKNVLIIMVPTLINKDVFEPPYNDLKFTVQNLNYFCTKLLSLNKTGEKKKLKL